MKHTIAIIGGGASAVAFCTEMVEALQNSDISESIEIIIFEKSKEIGPGLPYSEKGDYFILNLPVEVMDTSSSKGNFSRWMENCCPESHSSFPPRYYFGLYLKEKLQQCQETIRAMGLEFTCICDCEVLDIDHDKKDNFFLTTTLGNYIANYVILSTGHVLSDTYCELNNESGYINNPWNTDIYNEIDCTKNVAIMGTRLTAIDITLKLKARNHSGKILLVSRQGFLPAVLSPRVPFYPLRYLTLEKFSHLTQYGLKFLLLDDLLKLFWKEINEAENIVIDEKKIIRLNRILTPFERLKREIIRAERGSCPWQQVLFASYPIAPIVWNMLSLDDKNRFMDKYYSLYLTYLAAFPLENAKKILSMLESKQVEVIGGFSGVLKEKNGFKLIFKDKADRISDYLFNAAGLSYNLTSSPLYQNMLNHHFIISHVLGGIDINPKTLQVVSGSGEVHTKIFSL